MRRLIIAAAVVLVVQVALVVAVNMRQSGYTPYSPTERIAAVDPAVIDELAIDARDEGQIQLRRVEGKWFIAGQGGLQVPAADDQVNGVLEKITSFKRGLAVATSEEAAKRFEVAADSPAYLVRLHAQDGSTIKLFFGTSPGFRQIHVRTEGSDEIVTVGLGSHELSPAVEQWIDKDLLTFDGEKLQTLKIDDLAVHRRDDGWRVEMPKAADGEESEKAGRLVELASDLSIHGFLADPGESKAGEGKEMAMETVMDDGSTLQWSIVKHDENSHAVVRSDLEYALLVSSWQIDDIKKLIDEIQSGETAKGDEPLTSESTQEEDVVSPVNN